MGREKQTFKISLLMMIAYLFIPLSVSAETLLTAHCPQGECTKLIAYEFKDGVLTQSEDYNLLDILTQQKKMTVRVGMLDNPQILQDRYLIKLGIIYDLKEQELLHNGVEYKHIMNYEEGAFGLLLTVSGNQVIYSGYEDGKSYIYIYDLDKKTYSRANKTEEKKWKLPTAERSPDGLSSISIETPSTAWFIIKNLIQMFTPERVETGYHLLHHTFNGSEQVTTRIGTARHNWHWHIALWLDNERIMVPTYDGELYVLDVDGSEDLLLTVPTGNAECCGNRDLYQGVSGDIYYNLDNKTVYQIDTENRSYSEAQWHNYNNGFELENVLDQQDKKALRYHHKDIDSGFYSNVITDKRIVAVTRKGADNKNAISVWSEETKSWKDLANEQNVTYVLLGWI